MTTRLIPTKKGREVIKRLRKIEKLKKSSSRNDLMKWTNIIVNSDVLKELNAAYKKHSPKPKPKRFQHPSGSTMVIYDETSTEIYRFTGAISKKKLAKIVSRYPEATILIDVGSGIHKQIPIKTFKKMIKIKFVMFQREYEMFGIDEYEPISKSGDWFVPETVIDNVYSINELLKLFIIEEAFDKASSVFLAAKFYDLVGSEKTCKVLYKNGKAKVFSYEDFLEEYKLDMKMNIFEKKKKKKK